MKIERINAYHDHRFSRQTLNQHGCFVIDGQPYEIEIISDFEALVRGGERSVFPELIEEFRFYTPHITLFYDESREVVAQFPPAQIISLNLADIQPTQFYVDEDKLAAVGTFLHSQADIIIQAGKWGERYLALDGHTRLYYAVSKGWTQVRAVIVEYDTWAEDFAREAIARNICSPYAMKLVPHDAYEVKWNQFCDDFFAERKPNGD